MTIEDAMAEDVRLIEDGQFKNIIKRRLFTLRYRMNGRIRLQDFPKHDDELVREELMLRKLARFHRMRGE